MNKVTKNQVESNVVKNHVEKKVARKSLSKVSDNLVVESVAGLKFSDVPDFFQCCAKESCPLATECLRRIAWTAVDDSVKYVRVVNPLFASGDAACKRFHSSKPLRYAFGFTTFREKMYPSQYARFKSICLERFGRTTFFERRRGERPIPPSEQEYIMNALKKAGVEAQLDFDSYKYMVCWD